MMGNAGKSWEIMGGDGKRKGRQKGMKRGVWERVGRCTEEKGGAGNDGK